ncbi:Gfo/Idh/MocA family oxidoreductase [Curtobacterium ammoniigenes]|uniref:Gfo/Idh/MocA family oxidoreductase n=1 Tax=Curtobacterium ammoniigenes TaxID=395387 RepID=UPI00082A0AC8|nr:Gfo/Idh/MocA family oxidoreductase [Curtobacterium ammoniigenes]
MTNPEATGQPPRDQSPASVGIIGTGWRAGFFLRVASDPASPFRVRRLLAHSDVSAETARARWGIPTDTSLHVFLREHYDFVLIAVPRDAAPSLAGKLAARDVAVLLETPPAPDLPTLRSLYQSLGPNAPIQVAEQYPYQPHHAARLAVAHAHAFGAVTSAAVSAAHEYHAIRLIRSFLRVGFDDTLITAQQVSDRVARTLSSTGWASDMASLTSTRTLAQLRFPDDKLGLYDFEDEQYFSPIRTRHVLVRGERGEISDDRVSLMTAPEAPVLLHLERRHTGIDGDLEGASLDRITLGRDVVYRSPFRGARLSDDEIAIATVCDRMRSFAREGIAFSPLGDACHDSYLAHLVTEAAHTGTPVASTPQPWSTTHSVLQ